MSNSNPYYDPSADDDIFGDAGSSGVSATGHKHSIDGSVCPRCSRPHPPVPEDMDPEARTALLELLDAMPDALVDVMIGAFGGGMAGGEVPPHAHFMQVFFQAVHASDYDNRPGPVLRAVAEVLDELSGGQVSRRIKIYECERQLIVTHRVLKTCNNAMEEARSQDMDGPLWLMGFACEFLLDRLGIIASQYRKLCAEASMDPDEQVIEVGLLTNPDDMTRYTMIELMSKRDQESILS